MSDYMPNIVKFGPFIKKKLFLIGQLYYISAIGTIELMPK